MTQLHEQTSLAKMHQYLFEYKIQLLLAKLKSAYLYIK